MFIKLCLCLILGLFVFNPIKSLSQPTDCLDMFVYDPANSCTYVETVKEWIEIPMYNDCKVQFTFKVYECEEASPTPPCTTKRKYKVFRITGFNPDWGCPEIMQAIFPGYPNDYSYTDDVVLKTLMSYGESVISEMLFLEHYNSLSQAGKDSLKCGGTPPDCGIPVESSCTLYSIFFTQPACFKYCISIVQLLPNVWVPYIDVIRCVEEGFGCCVTKRIYCVCDDGINPPTINSISISEPISGSCLENDTSCPIRNDPYGNGLRYESECYHFCPIE